MTTTFIVGIATAFWLGILTSISPCPLTTNIAAVSFVGKRVGSAGKVFISGLLYTLGRAFAYTALGAFIVAGMLSIPSVSFFLQKHMHKLLGPVLVISGILLIGIIPLKFGVSFNATGIQKRAEKAGMFSAALLGILFALAFCPVSAALFFGSLIPLAIKHESRIILPAIYGIGTGLPVLLFAILMALGIGSIGKMFNAMTRFEIWARRITGVVFIGVGAWLVYMSYSVPSF
jgi:cytochrome c-type biogenesis protein